MPRVRHMDVDTCSRYLVHGKLFVEFGRILKTFFLTSCGLYWPRKGRQDKHHGTGTDEIHCNVSVDTARDILHDKAYMRQ
jgi:hypothetical protein